MFKSNFFQKLKHVVSGDKELKKEAGAEAAEPEAVAAENAAAEKAITEKDVPNRDNTQVLKKLAAQNQQEDKAHINAGVKAYAGKEYDKAIEHYQQAIEINPSDGSLYNNIGNVYLRGKNDPETALQYYLQATTVQPSFNYGWYNLALCQKALGDISGARTTVSQGLNELEREDSLYEILTQLQAQLK